MKQVQHEISLNPRLSQSEKEKNAKILENSFCQNFIFTTTSLIKNSTVTMGKRKKKVTVC
jgi:hypothetical protein